MGWLIKEKRGPAWKHGWSENTINSASPPPLPVISIFLIVVFLLYLSFSFNYNKQMEKTMVGMKLFLFLLPVLLIFLANFGSVGTDGNVMPYHSQRVEFSSNQQDGGSSFLGLAMLVLLIIVLFSIQSSFESKPSALGSPSGSF